MELDRRRTLVAVAVALVVGLAAGLTIGIVDDQDDEPGESGGPVSEEPAALEPQGSPNSKKDPDAAPRRTGEAGEDPKLPPPESDPQGLAPGPSGPPPTSEAERAAAAAARSYVRSLDARDGAAVCRAFAPGALRPLDFPEQRRGCAATVEASLGYQGKRGMPVWRRSEMTDAVSASVSGDAARVVATIFTRYADRREPSIEDDIIYLTQAGARWLLAKPSATIHRAIGNADIPPSVLTPP